MIASGPLESCEIVAVSDSEQQQRIQTDSSEKSRQSIRIEALADQIRADAENESVFYLLRSNTRCDGE